MRGKSHEPTSPLGAALSRAIWIARRAKGWSQKELAAILGIDYKLLSKIENARTTPDRELLRAII